MSLSGSKVESMNSTLIEIESVCNSFYGGLGLAGGEEIMLIQTHCIEETLKK